MNTKPTTIKQIEQKQIIQLPPNRFVDITIDDLTQSEQQSIIATALNILGIQHKKGEPLTSPANTMKYFQLLFAERKNEVFGLLFLDNQHRIICFEELFQGTIDGASVYPRIIVQRALEVNAAAVIATHNHPSGILEPSQADKQITAKIQQSLMAIEIRLLDHFIVSSEGSYSFAEHGLI